MNEFDNIPHLLREWRSIMPTVSIVFAIAIISPEFSNNHGFFERDQNQEIIRTNSTTDLEHIYW